MKISNIVFLNRDQYDNVKMWLHESETEEYNSLKKIAKSLKQKYTGYQPIFHAMDKGISLTVKKYNFNFSEGSTYNIEFVAVQKTRQSDDSPYVILKLATKPTIVKENKDEILDLENL